MKLHEIAQFLPFVYYDVYIVGGLRGLMQIFLPDMSAMQDFNSFSIMFYYIISTTYQKIGDLFCPVYISGLSHSVIHQEFRKYNLLKVPCRYKQIKTGGESKGLSLFFFLIFQRLYLFPADLCLSRLQNSCVDY